MQEVLSILKSGSSASSSAVPAGDERPAQSDQKTGILKACGDLSDEESDDDGLSFARRLAGVAGKKVAPKQVAKPKATAKTQSRAGGSNLAMMPSAARQPVSVPVRVVESKPTAEAEAVEPQQEAGKGEPASKSTFALDGRGNRTKETLNKHLKDFAARHAQLGAVVFGKTGPQMFVCNGSGILLTRLSKRVHNS